MKHACWLSENLAKRNVSPVCYDTRKWIEVVQGYPVQDTSDSWWIPPPGKYHLPLIFLCKALKIFIHHNHNLNQYLHPLCPLQIYFNCNWHNHLATIYSLTHKKKVFQFEYKEGFSPKNSPAILRYTWWLVTGVVLIWHSYWPASDFWRKKKSFP